MKPPFKLNELDLPEGQEYEPPEGTRIIQPFKELTSHYAYEHREEDDWLIPWEKDYLAPLGQGIARVFEVDLINDAQYNGLTEDQRATWLTCLLTRSQLRETQTGVFAWHPLCVVVKYCIMVAVEVRLDRTKRTIEIPKFLLWANDQQSYIPIFDEKTGRIDNPADILQVLATYARMEGLV